MTSFIISGLITLGLVGFITAQNAPGTAKPDPQPAPPAAQKIDLATLEPAEFLKWTRRSPLSESWSGMKGEISHKRRGQPRIREKIALSTRFTPLRAYAQLILEPNEGYIVTQSFQSDARNSAIMPTLPQAQQKLPLYGLRPDDLTLSFIYWDYKAEQAQDSYRMQKCRVFDLEKGDEFVRVWITIEQGFPIKAEWYKKGETERYRQLEITSMVKGDNDLWMPTELSLEGPGWKTRLQFDEHKASTDMPNMPKDLFRPIKPLGTGTQMAVDSALNRADSTPKED